MRNTFLSGQKNSMTAIKVIKEKIAWKHTVPAIFLVSNTFVWYVIIYLIFSNIVNELPLLAIEKMILFAMYFTSIAFSAILGSKCSPKVRVKLLYVWLLIDVAATPFLITVYSNSLLANVLFALFLGFSIGIGLPSCLSYFADSTKIENRGSVGGVVWSAIGFIVLLFVVIANAIKPWEVVIALTAWRIFGGICFVLMKKQHKEFSDKSQSYISILSRKEIWLYLFPWIMFSFINFSELPILESAFGTEVFIFVTFGEYVFAGIFALVGGIIADLIGRKRIVIIGFIMLGIEYAALSVFYSLPSIPYLFMVLDGITWGFFFSVFFMTVWGDLGEGYVREKYYALGGLPFLLSNFVSVVVEPYVSAISPTAAFSFASFFLFLAVIPLMYAPETLPEKAMKERELKSYIEKAKKVREKFT
ncbi:MAG: hypothetical protein ACPLKQ_06505 [Candidatus Bathyarchaeales archaeon]